MTMKKRMIIGLAAGALVASTLPGVASASANVQTTGRCVAIGALERAADPQADSPYGPYAKVGFDTKGPQPKGQGMVLFMTCGVPS